jgi:hypothetical protein
MEFAPAGAAIAASSTRSAARLLVGLRAFSSEVDTVRVKKPRQNKKIRARF